MISGPNIEGSYDKDTQREHTPFLETDYLKGSLGSLIVQQPLTAIVKHVCTGEEILEPGHDTRKHKAACACCGAPSGAPACPGPPGAPVPQLSATTRGGDRGFLPGPPLDVQLGHIAQTSETSTWRTLCHVRCE